MHYEIVPMTTLSEMEEKGLVHYTAFKETYAALMPKEYLGKLTLENCIQMAQKQPQSTLLLKVAQKTVGFSCIKQTDNGSELVAIYLLAPYHGKGLGYALLKKTLSLCPKNSKIVLWVLKGNEKAISFYKKVGFRFSGNEKMLPFGIELQMEM